MIKTAIFVEGQTELIFVREMLLKIYEWQNISIECYTLFVDSKHHPTEYSFRSPNAEYYFQINNVGNDNSLLTRIKNREKWIWNDGFQRIVGLRDMYSKNYRECVQSGRIDPDVNKQFIDSHNLQINRFSSNPNNISFNFAIMETEAWILGFTGIFQRFNQEISNERIIQAFDYDIDSIDPESYFFHPAPEIDKIFRLVNGKYDKSKGDVSSIVSHFTKEDFIDLYNAPKCASFNPFYDSLHFSQASPERLL